MFSKEETSVYDRQIRLWGLNAQRKIRSANVLVIGMTGLASEMVKNLVLSGINSLTVFDDEIVSEIDMLANLFTRQRIGENRAKAIRDSVLELNPMVSVIVKDIPIKELLENENVLPTIEKFHVVIPFNQSLESTMALNKICNKCNVPFFSAGSWGNFAIIFNDLRTKESDDNGDDEQENKNDNFVDLETAYNSKNITFKNAQPGKRLSRTENARLNKIRGIFTSIMTLYEYNKVHNTFPKFPTDGDTSVLEDNLNRLQTELLEQLDTTNQNCNQQTWTPVDNWNQKIFGEFTQVASIAGGLLAQDVLRAISNELVDSNLFLFDGLTGYNVNIGLSN